MIIFDIILLIILSGFVFYLTVFDWVKNLFFGHELAGKVITFIVLFTLINRLIGFIFVLLDRTFDLISIIPFLKTINRLAGAALGFIEGGLVLGLALLFISETAFSGWLAASKVAPFLIGFAKAIMPLLPGLLERVKGVM